MPTMRRVGASRRNWPPSTVEVLGHSRFRRARRVSSDRERNDGLAVPGAVRSTNEGAVGGPSPRVAPALGARLAPSASAAELGGGALPLTSPARAHHLTRPRLRGPAPARPSPAPRGAGAPGTERTSGGRRAHAPRRDGAGRAGANFPVGRRGRARGA